MKPPRLIAGGLLRVVRRARSALRDPLFCLTGAAALVVVGVFTIATYFLVAESQESLTRFGPAFLTGVVWNSTPTTYAPEVYGALPAIFGTLLTSALGMILAVPLSLGIAMFLTELAPGWVRGSLSFVIELLAAIPSVVYGVWGAIVLAPYMGASVEPLLHQVLGPVPILGSAFQPTSFGFSGTDSFTAGVILAIMVIPTISAVSREAFLAVPIDQREAALSLGATRWETTRLSVFPFARRGVLGAITLGLGRAIGETIAVALVIGNSYAISRSLFAPGSTIASWIAQSFGTSQGTERAALLELGLVLLGVSLLVNVVARLLVRGGARSTGSL
ncbi:MAG: phosphate ABC transporter permease subunit PstC [Thermoplasmata archaeon]|nr:phosphate ABC transporter permease subunit PstC [Thermoplasmata archaeon]